MTRLNVMAQTQCETLQSQAEMACYLLQTACSSGNSDMCSLLAAQKPPGSNVSSLVELASLKKHEKAELA